MYFIGLLTRCKDEFFIKEFCEYYLEQGVDKIFVLDDNSNDKSIYEPITDERVEIIYEKKLFDKYGQMRIANSYYKKISKDFKWLIFVDVDEFITTKHNGNNTIRRELETTFADADCIKIPWVMMATNGIHNNPQSVLIENTYRWNHDQKHPHKIAKFRCRYNKIEVKCIFRPAKFKTISVHHPDNPIGNPKIVNSINNNDTTLNPYHNDLREDDIRTGYLLCYHHRIISRENAINKLNKTQYLKYTIDDLMNGDHSEIEDTTLKNKVLNIQL